MFYKKFEQYIIFCLIKQITIVLYVSGRPTDSDETILFTDKQLDVLAQGVCSKLQFEIKVAVKTCKENYWAPAISVPRRPSHLRIRCQTNTILRVQIDPSENYQLVALVPHVTNDSTVITDIDYVIIDPMDEYGEISRSPKKNYTLWSAVLQQGYPVMWRGGEKVPEYNKSMVHRTYEIKKVLYPSLDGFDVFGQFTWNTSGNDDVCFDVVSSCKKQKMIKFIKLRPNGKDSPQVEIHHLPGEDECYINVTGLYGRTDFKYRTLPCKTIICSFVETYPEVPGTYIEAIHDSINTFKVTVRWGVLRFLPDYYNVTLVSSEITLTMILPWNSIEAVFKNVTGAGGFIVLIQARFSKQTAVITKRAVFPGAAIGEGGAAIGVGGAAFGVGGTAIGEGGAAVGVGGTAIGVSGAAVGVGGAAIGVGCAAAALALLFHYRRRKHHVSVSPYNSDDKPSKDGDTEVLEIWSETEERWEVRPDKLVLHEVIGEGAFGVVRRAMLGPPPHSVQVAVKMLKDFPSFDEVRSFRSEMELMNSVGAHPHLVRLVGRCIGKRPFIVVEYCSRGDLLSYLRSAWDVMFSKRNAKYYSNNIDDSDYRDNELTGSDLLSFCRQIAMGMEFLAANKVVHRDLAARNILVTADRTLKIADFGLSRDVYEENQYKQKSNEKMPVKWMALESLTRRIYTTQSDVWSFGVVVWEIATVGGAPYASVPAARLPRLLRGGYRMPKPNNCSPQLYDIMLSCWRIHPRDRPNFVELHQRLDELLNSACSNEYLSLEIDDDDAPLTPNHHNVDTSRC